jgi:hypothetical protein
MGRWPASAPARPAPGRHLGVLARAVLGFATGSALGACADRTEPPPSTILARPLGGDSLSPGAMNKICGPDAVGCVPTYAVMCKVEDMTPGQTAAIRTLSPDEQEWCAAH